MQFQNGAIRHTVEVLYCINVMSCSSWPGSLNHGGRRKSSVQAGKKVNISQLFQKILPESSVYLEERVI
jgi:hypothetical protein